LAGIRWMRPLDIIGQHGSAAYIMLAFPKCRKFETFAACQTRTEQGIGVKIDTEVWAQDTQRPSKLGIEILHRSKMEPLFRLSTVLFFSNLIF